MARVSARTACSKGFRFAVLASLATSLLGPAPVSAQTASQAAGTKPRIQLRESGAVQVSGAVRRVAEAAAPAVLTVRGSVDQGRTAHRGSLPDVLERLLPKEFGRQEERPDLQPGTGFIIDSSGYVVTNYRLVDGATTIETILSDGRKLPARLVRSDPANGVALLKVEATGLPTIPLGTSSSLRGGEVVMAIGKSEGRDHAVTVGTLNPPDRSSETDPSTGARRDLATAPNDGLLRTDMAISSEASGGPLITMRGEAVGIVAAAASRGGEAETGGQAVPVDITGSILHQFLTAVRPTGSTGGATLGVSTQELTPELARSFGVSSRQGVLVTSVDPTSPAAAAGIQAGDVLVRYEGRVMRSSQDLSEQLSNARPGRTIEVSIVRDRVPRSVRVTLGEMSNVSRTDLPGGSRRVVERLGLELQQLTPDLARRLGVQSDSGVVVTDVRPDSPAARAGLVTGDLIREVNQAPVETIYHVEQEVPRPFGGPSEILMRLERKGSQRYVVVSLR